MGFTTIDTSKMSLSDWLEARRPYIGGSDAPAVAGLSQWRSPFAVALDKLGMVPPVEDNESMFWGRTLEKPIAQHACHILTDIDGELEGQSLEYSPRAMYVSERYSWAAVNLDGQFIGAGIECKNYGRDRASAFADDGIPADLTVQCLHAMAVRDDFACMYAAVLCGGNRFFLRRIDRDEKAIADLMSIEQEFYEKVMVGKEIPAPTGMDNDRDLLTSLYPEPSEDTLTLGDDEAALAREYREAAAIEKEAVARKKAAHNQLFAIVGSAKRATAGPYKLTRIHSEVAECVRPAYSSDYLKITGGE